MKQITILLLLMIFSIIGCEKNDPAKPSEPIAEIDKLPPATQIGANTFGCLYDGINFTPGNAANPLDCQYQYVNKGYYFAITAVRRFDPKNYISIGLGTIQLQIFEGNTYPLLRQEIGKANGSLYKNYTVTYTSDQYTGELKITKLDPVNYIISGTFWFDIIDNRGVKHEIREGRFDMHYTN